MCATAKLLDDAVFGERARTGKFARAIENALERRY
jgi:hypothetical protein